MTLRLAAAALVAWSYLAQPAPVMSACAGRPFCVSAVLEPGQLIDLRRAAPAVLTVILPAAPAPVQERQP